MPTAPQTDSTSDRELVATRLLAAPRELVWRAYSEPEHLAGWWGPQGFSNTFQTFEFREGGAWSFVMHDPDGNDYKNECVFVELAKPERVVLDHESWPLFQLTFTLAEEGGKTRVTMRQVFEQAADYEKVKGFAARANEENLERLDGVVAGIS